MELEVSMGHQERTCMHLHGDEQPAGGAYPARERRKMPLLTTRLEEGADYEVQRGTEGAGVGGSEEKSLVNLSRQY